MNRAARLPPAAENPSSILPALSPGELAGKSTLINALLSEQLLPSNNVPETSRIVALEHSAAAAAGAPPRLSYAAADGSPVSVEGASAIREHLRELNAAARESGSSSGSGSSGSLLAREAPLDVQVAFTALSSCPELGGRLCVLDTPGELGRGGAWLARSLPSMFALV